MSLVVEGEVEASPPDPCFGAGFLVISILPGTLHLLDMQGPKVTTGRGPPNPGPWLQHTWVETLTPPGARPTFLPAAPARTPLAPPASTCTQSALIQVLTSMCWGPTGFPSGSSTSQLVSCHRERGDQREPTCKQASHRCRSLKCPPPPSCPRPSLGSHPCPTFSGAAHHDFFFLPLGW